MIRSAPLTRRELIQRTFETALAVGVSPAMSFCAEDAAVHPERIIDTHTHFYDPTRPQGVPWPAKDSSLYRQVLPKDYRIVAAAQGVSGTVVVEASPWLEDNQWLLDLAADDPFLVGVVGHLDPHGEQFPEQLSRFAKDPLFRGIRIRASDIARQGDAGFLDHMRRLADYDLSVDLLGGAAMLPDAVRLASRVPSLRIIVDHLPFDMPDDAEQKRRLESALSQLSRHANVYAKISNVLRRVDDRTIVDVEFYRPTLDRLWELFGPGRVVYGSNWPVSDRVAPYSDIQRVVMQYMASLGQEAADKYFWKNSQAIYRWVNREPNS